MSARESPLKAVHAQSKEKNAALDTVRAWHAVLMILPGYIQLNLCWSGSTFGTVLAWKIGIAQGRSRLCAGNCKVSNRRWQWDIFSEWDLLRCCWEPVLPVVTTVHALVLIVVGMAIAKSMMNLEMPVVSVTMGTLLMA